MMRAWIEADDKGTEFLVRAGTGVVTALVPVGIADPDSVRGHPHTFYRVEIYCDAPHGRPGAIRFSAHPIIAVEDQLFAAAVETLREVWPVAWTAEWHRHDWIPTDLPIGSLDLATDARCILSALDRVALPELLDDGVPDFIPARWAVGVDDGAE